MNHHSSPTIVESPSYLPRFVVRRNSQEFAPVPKRQLEPFLTELSGQSWGDLGIRGEWPYGHTHRIRMYGRLVLT